MANVWKPLFDRFGIHIDFAHTTFKWTNDTAKAAAVHVVIVGFSCSSTKATRSLFVDGKERLAKCISPYLRDEPVVFVESRTTPIQDVPSIKSGGKPVEGGFLIFTVDEKERFVKEEPMSEKWFRPFIGSDDFISGKERWCLWLLDANPHELRRARSVLARVEAVKQFRLESKKDATKKMADFPTRFMEIKEPKESFLLFPATSSENRAYIPLGYLPPSYIPSNAASFMEGATLFHLGVLVSSVHMTWMRAVAGRLEMSYRYSNNVVYNNFPWCDPTEAQKKRIEETAKAILDARALYPECSLADLYDDLLMPKELRKAHEANDKAVMDAYGFNYGMTEAEIVTELMKLYQKLTK